METKRESYAEVLVKLSGKPNLLDLREGGTRLLRGGLLDLREGGARLLRGGLLDLREGGASLLRGDNSPLGFQKPTLLWGIKLKDSFFN